MVPKREGYLSRGKEPCSCQGSEVRLVDDHREATIAHTTTGYRRGLQNEHRDASNLEAASSSNDKQSLIKRPGSGVRHLNRPLRNASSSEALQSS